MVVGGRNAGTATAQVENGKKLKESLNGRNVHYAGEMEVIAASIVVEQVCLIKLK